MLAIVGGTYSENCLHPDWRHLWGSGLRAAIAVVDLVDDVHLYTTVSDAERAAIERKKEQFDLAGVHVAGRGGNGANSKGTVYRSTPIEFQYDHSADGPRLFPDYRDLVRTPPFELTRDLENVLLFSFIEFTSVPAVRAKRLVYDPQAGNRAIPFSRTGSVADHVALVVNLSEGRAIARQLNVRNYQEVAPIPLARTLLRAERVEVVVVKNGPYGACIATQDGALVIPAYKTREVFGIGTGDVFSAVFAAFWASHSVDAFESARLAAAATAFYSANRGALPIPNEVDTLHEGLEPVLPSRFTTTGKLKGKPPLVYLAGPFFDLGQRWLINKAFEALTDLELQVWSPSAEAGILDEGASKGAIRRVVEQDLQGLEKSNAVFAILNGMDPGSIFEVGHAVARQTPVVAFVERAGPAELTMMTGTECDMYDDLASAVYNLAWTAYRL